MTTLTPVERFPTLRSVLAAAPPQFLFHYTGPSAFLGICESGILWAGRAGDMNDSKEQVMSIDSVDNYAMNTLDLRRPTDEEDCAFWETVRERRGEANRQVFTISLTEERDALEQWRAYCPRSGGVAIGLPTDHLCRAAADQHFFLARCSYQHQEQYRLIAEVCEYHYAQVSSQEVDGIGP